MGRYRIELTRSAERTLKNLPRFVIPRVVSAIEGLSSDPRPPGCRKLSGEERTYRIRVLVYRIVYEVYDDFILVRVLKIGHRKDIYR